MKDKRGDIIVGRARLSNLDVKRMAKKAGMCLSTVYKRIQLPGTMTIDELAAINRAVHFEDEEILQIVKGS